MPMILVPEHTFSLFTQSVEMYEDQKRSQKVEFQEERFLHSYEIKINQPTYDHDEKEQEKGHQCMGWSEGVVRTRDAFLYPDEVWHSNDGPEKKTRPEEVGRKRHVLVCHTVDEHLRVGQCKIKPKCNDRQKK